MSTMYLVCAAMGCNLASRRVDCWGREQRDCVARVATHNIDNCPSCELQSRLGSLAMDRDRQEEFEQFVDIGPAKITKPKGKFRKYYTGSLESWISNAGKIKLDYPEEIAKLWVELLRSDFSLQFIFDAQKYLTEDTNTWSYEKKVSYIRDSYESVYAKFIMLALCCEYSKERVSRLREDWFILDTGKSFDPKMPSAWSHKGDNISGTRWIMKNNLLFKKYSLDTDLWAKIRLSSSHNRIMVGNDSVVIVNGEASEEISQKIDSICEEIYNCELIALDFHAKLLVFHEFWIPPYIIATFPDTFNYDLKFVAFNMLNSFLQPTRKKGGKTEVSDRAISFLGLVFKYFMNYMWESIVDDKVYIDLLTKPKGIELDVTKVGVLRAEALLDALNLILGTKSSLQYYLGIPASDRIELTADNITQVDYISELLQIKDLALRCVRERPGDGGSHVFAIITLTGFHSVLGSIGKLGDFGDAFNKIQVVRASA